MTHAAPAATVLLRVYNGEKYVREAIASILVQTFADFELLVIDDGSTDATPAILREFTGDDRVRIVRQTNQGVAVAAREGLKEARGTFVAIIDSDDRAHPDRLSRQIQFLRSNEDHVIVGSAMRLIDQWGQPIGLRPYPRTNDRIERATMLFNPFGHSATCFRRDEALACGGYTEEFPGAEDFDFNVRLRRFGKGANLPDALVDYRIHAGAFKAERLRQQLSDTIRLRSVLRQRLGYRWSPQAAAVDSAERLMLFMPGGLVGWLFRRAFFRGSDSGSLDPALGEGV